MDTLLIFLLGALIGWNLPRPPWAVSLQDRALQIFASLATRAYQWLRRTLLPPDNSDRPQGP